MIIDFIYILLLFVAIIGIYKNNIMSTFIFVIFITKGLSMLPAEGMFIKATHLSFAYLLFFTILRYNQVKILLKNNQVAKKIYALMLFFIASIFVSIIIYGFPVKECVVTGLRYFVLGSFFVFCSLNKKEYKQLIQILYYITLFASAAFIIQCLTGVQLLPAAEDAIGDLDAQGLYHWGNMPVMTLIFGYMSLFNRKILPKSSVNFAPIVFFTAILCTMYRSLIVNVLLTMALIIFLQGKLKKAIIPLVIVVFGYFIFKEALVTRFDKGGDTLNDIEAVFTMDFNSADYRGANGLTMIYRFAWVYERGLYQIHNPVRLLFGLGLVTDESVTPYKFDFGLENLDKGTVSQIRTPDIAYGNMLTCYGLIGSIIFFMMYFSILKELKYWYKNNQTALVLFSILLCSLLLGFTGENFSEPYWWGPVFLFYGYARKYNGHLLEVQFKKKSPTQAFPN